MEITDELMQAVVDVVLEAGASVLPFFKQSELDVHKKEDCSPITQADLSAHNILKQGLQQLTPDWPFLSEESEEVPYAIRQQWQRYWLVDPLDGTKEFINQNPEFTVNVALIDKGIPILGVVYSPALGLCYAGGSQLGAWKKSTGAPVSPWQAISVSLGDARATTSLAVAVSRNHVGGATQSLLNHLRHHFKSINLQSIGSSLKICLCAEGGVDLYPRLAPTCEWDTAAAQAILEAAGGTLFDVEGAVLRYNTKSSLLNAYFFAVRDSDYLWRSLLVPWWSEQPEAAELK